MLSYGTLQNTHINIIVFHIIALAVTCGEQS